MVLHDGLGTLEQVLLVRMTHCVYRGSCGNDVMHSVQWDAARICRSNAWSMRVLHGTIVGWLCCVRSDHVELRGSYVAGSNTMLGLHNGLRIP